MAQTKTQRTIIKAVKAWCEADPHREFVKLERSNKSHDIIRVIVWDIPIKVTVDCTPKGGPDKAAKKCISNLNTASRRKIQAIIEGRGKIY